MFLGGIERDQWYEMSKWDFPIASPTQNHVESTQKDARITSAESASAVIFVNFDSTQSTNNELLKVCIRNVGSMLALLLALLLALANDYTI